MAFKVLRIKAHDRTIRTREFKFRCRQCRKNVTRDCYPGPSPKYCTACRPPKSNDQHHSNVVTFVPSLPAKKVQTN